MKTHEIRIDRTKTLAQDPGTGHNRFHPDIPPVIRCDVGDEVILETRDAFDGQFGPDASLQVVAKPNLDVMHPLTGPVYVNGAKPGDLLDKGAHLLIGDAAMNSSCPIGDTLAPRSQGELL